MNDRVKIGYDRKHKTIKVEHQGHQHSGTVDKHGNVVDFNGNGYLLRAALTAAKIKKMGKLTLTWAELYENGGGWITPTPPR